VQLEFARNNQHYTCTQWHIAVCRHNTTNCVCCCHRPQVSLINAATNYDNNVAILEFALLANATLLSKQASKYIKHLT
jgi:hypothetical protein